MLMNDDYYELCLERIRNINFLSDMLDRSNPNKKSFNLSRDVFCSLFIIGLDNCEFAEAKSLDIAFIEMMMDMPSLKFDRENLIKILDLAVTRKVTPGLNKALVMRCFESFNSKASEDDKLDLDRITSVLDSIEADDQMSAITHEGESASRSQSSSRAGGRAAVDSHVDPMAELRCDARGTESTAISDGKIYYKIKDDILFIGSSNLVDGIEAVPKLVSSEESGVYRKKDEVVSWMPWCFNRDVTRAYIIESIAPDQRFGFTGMKELVSIEGLNLVDTSKLTDMSYMFAYCDALGRTSFGEESYVLDLSSFDTSSVTDMSYMFCGCNGLEFIDFSSFDTSSVVDMSGMFSYCDAIDSLDLSNFDTSHVTSMYQMFRICEILNPLDLTAFDTSAVTNMAEMFCCCTFTDYIDVSSFDTSSVTDMSYMFSCCHALGSLDLTSFDTSKVISMEEMFSSCHAIRSLDLSSFNTSNVTNMRCMFEGCRELSFLNLSSFDTSAAVNLEGMFSNCPKLESFDLSSFAILPGAFTSYMFDGCVSLSPDVLPEWAHS